MHERRAHLDLNMRIFLSKEFFVSNFKAWGKKVREKDPPPRFVKQRDWKERGKKGIIMGILPIYSTIVLSFLERHHENKEVIRLN
jgi:hypothetical protein